MPRKQWAAFERLTAADLNANLADQSVMVFATTTARDAAIPSPSVGMQSAVTASPDLGAPRYWDGSAWTLVQNGANVPAVWSRGDASGQETITLNYTGAVSGSWVQISASFGRDVIIHGISLVCSSNNRIFEFQVGTGAAGSEVVRWTGRGDPGSYGNYYPIAYGVGVPNGTRAAFRISSFTLSPFATYRIHYTPIGTAPAYSDHAITGLYQCFGTAYTQIGSTPPSPFTSTGCWIIGIVGANWSTGGTPSGVDVKYQLAFGSAGSEVTASGYMTVPDELQFGTAPQSVVDISPIWWAPGTRLAFRSNNASVVGSDAFRLGVALRGSLT